MKPRKPMRRTGINRGDSELRRSSSLQSKRPALQGSASSVKPNGPVKARRQKDTGPTKSVRDAVKARATVDGTPQCEVCGVAPGHDIHHRQPRGAGGCPLPYINAPSNLLWVCGHGNALPGCHGVIENGRENAKSVGWLVPRPGLPVEVPVLWRGVRVLLDDQGGMEPAPDEPRDRATSGVGSAASDVWTVQTESEVA